MAKVIDQEVSSPSSLTSAQSADKQTIIFGNEGISVKQGEVTHRAVVTTINFTEVLAYADGDSITVYPVNKLSQAEQRQFAAFQRRSARRQVIERTSQVLV